MSAGGLSQARLGRMHDVMAGSVERGDVPGIVTLVSRRGEVHVDAIGMQAVGGSDPIWRDTIFRITSMTKPITAAATQKAVSGLFLGDNRGWGFGVSIITKRDDVASVPGRFGWDGGYGTSWSSDPQEDMVAILMTQRLGFASDLYLDFWTSAYQAIDD